MHSQNPNLWYLVNAYFAYGAQYACQLSSNPTLTYFSAFNWSRNFSWKIRKIDIWGDYLPGSSWDTHSRALFFTYTTVPQQL